MKNRYVLKLANFGIRQILKAYDPERRSFQKLSQIIENSKLWKISDFSKHLTKNSVVLILTSAMCYALYT